MMNSRAPNTSVTGFHVLFQTNEIPNLSIASRAPSKTFQMIPAMISSHHDAPRAPSRRGARVSPMRSKT